MMKSDARRSLTDLRASLFDIIIFRRKELTTEPRGRTFRRQFLLLSRKRLGLEAAQRIFLVQGLRNQWLSRFVCTKAAATFRRCGTFSWCKAYAINGFPGLLAPKPPPFSGGAVHFLGAKPTQSMALPLCLHQSRRRFRAAAASAGGVQATAADRRPASYFFRGLPFALVRFRFAVFGFITEKPKKPRGSFLRA